MRFFVLHYPIYLGDYHNPWTGKWYYPASRDDTGFWTLLKIGYQNLLVNHIPLYVSLLNWWLFQGTIIKFPIFSETPICLSLTLKYLCCWAYTVNLMFLCIYRHIYIYMYAIYIYTHVDIIYICTLHIISSWIYDIHDICVCLKMEYTPKRLSFIK